MSLDKSFEKNAITISRPTFAPINTYKSIETFPKKSEPSVSVGKDAVNTP